MPHRAIILLAVLLTTVAVAGGMIGVVNASRAEQATTRLSTRYLVLHGRPEGETDRRHRHESLDLNDTSAYDAVFAEARWTANPSQGLMLEPGPAEGTDRT